MDKSIDDLKRELAECKKIAAMYKEMYENIAEEYKDLTGLDAYE